MESVIISETYRTDSHIDCDPAVNHDHIRIKQLPADKHITDNIYKQCRNTEIYEKRRPAKNKKAHESYNHKEYGCIDRICKFFNFPKSTN